VTALLGSSSAAIVMLIALVNAGALGFAPAMGVVMGCNIGTTVKSQIVAFDLGSWLPVPMVVGFLLMFLGRRSGHKPLGQVLFGIGLVFFALQAMEHAVAPLRAHDRWMEWVTHLESPSKGTMAGALISAVIQSSSGTVAMVITFAQQELMTLPAEVAIMFGAELGTCADTLIASLGRHRAALKTGLFHLAFNVVAVLLGLTLIGPFTQLVERVTAGGDLPRLIANAHTVFNVASVLILVWLAPTARRLFDRLLPDEASAA
jgi:phosphate:Na+ symporter